jgi:antitoxin component of MazEF toxin-antitoxin module
MTTRVERVGDRLAIQVFLSEEMLEALSIAENDVLEVEEVDGKLQIAPAAELPRHLAAYRRTRDEHAGVYRELAK